MKKKKKRVIGLIGIEIIILGACVVIGIKSIDKPKWKLTQYSDDSGNQAMFYTITSNENDLILVDGGWDVNAAKVRKVIREAGNHVDAWILTHPHPDHIGVFNEIYEQPGDIIIDQVYDNSLDYEYYDTLDQAWDGISVYADYLSLIEGEEKVHHISRDEKIEIKNLEFCFFNSYDTIAQGYSEDIGNDSSLVFKVNSGEKSILFTGDCHSETVAKHLMSEYGEELKADYVQMGHHGNNTLPNEFYELVGAEIAFFDAPEWLVIGETYSTKEAQAFMQSLGCQVVDYRTVPNEIALYDEKE